MTFFLKKAINTAFFLLLGFGFLMFSLILPLKKEEGA